MIEARHGSLFQRLSARGLLDSVMRQLIDGEKSLRQMARWLKGEGVATSQSSLYSLLRQHGLPWRYEQSQEAGRAMDLPEDMDEASAMVLRRKIQIATFHADGLKELMVLSKISGDKQKLAQAERNVKVAERKAKVVEDALAHRVAQTRMEAARIIDDVLGEMDSQELAALRAARTDSVQSGAPESERLRRIVRTVWGEQADFYPDTKEKEAA